MQMCGGIGSRPPFFVSEIPNTERKMQHEYLRIFYTFTKANVPEGTAKQTRSFRFLRKIKNKNKINIKRRLIS